MCTYWALGADKMTFAVDYPFGNNSKAREFIEKLPICDEDKQKICYLNAERMFGL